MDTKELLHKLSVFARIGEWDYEDESFRNMFDDIMWALSEWGATFSMRGWQLEAEAIENCADYADDDEWGEAIRCLRSIL